MTNPSMLTHQQIVSSKTDFHFSTTSTLSLMQQLFFFQFSHILFLSTFECICSILLQHLGHFNEKKDIRAI